MENVMEMGLEMEKVMGMMVEMGVVAEEVMVVVVETGKQ